MNEKFFELPEEKRMRIVNAGMEVFGKYEYKRAVTDEIAFKAGISKGLLFYYFHNKKNLYLFLYRQCNELMKTLIIDEGFENIHDFFELIAYGSSKKIAMIKQYPYIMDFAMKAYFSQNEHVSDEVYQDTQAALQDSFQLYFKNIDWSKFKDDVDFTYIYRMLIWMCDGYLHEVQMSQKPIDVDGIMKEFHRWMNMFRKMIYKEEYV